MNTLKRKREERITKAANIEIKESTIESAVEEVIISEPVKESAVVKVASIVKKLKKKKSSS